MISFFRTVVMYILVIISMRCMGKRQIGQLQPYEVVIALMIADLAALPMEDNSVPILNGILPILSLLFAQILISYAVVKSGRIRKIFCGTSKVVVKDGVICEEALKGELYTVGDLMEALRLKGYPDLSSVSEARLETNGELSVIPCSGQSPVVRQDLGIGGEDPLVEDIILCGRIMEENYDAMQVDGKALLREIRANGGRGVQDVLYAGARDPRSFVIQMKGRAVKKHEDA